MNKLLYEELEDLLSNAVMFVILIHCDKRFRLRLCNIQLTWSVRL